MRDIKRDGRRERIQMEALTPKIPGRALNVPRQSPDSGLRPKPGERKANYGTTLKRIF
jgi:hypothetical protein